jgi:hypothetical protein
VDSADILWLIGGDVDVRSKGGDEIGVKFGDEGVI